MEYSSVYTGAVSLPAFRLTRSGAPPLCYESSVSTWDAYRNSLAPVFPVAWRRFARLVDYYSATFLLKSPNAYRAFTRWNTSEDTLYLHTVIVKNLNCDS